MSFLAGIYLSLGMAYAEHLPPPKPPDIGWLWDVTDRRNPYGILEVGYTHDWGKVSVDIAGRHESSIAVKDHGFNSAEVRVRWRPFR